ncbi:MAG: glycosyl-4,4'-diaponeurosporenoate acyltransferase, partial [Fibrobacterota bacterium]
FYERYFGVKKWKGKLPDGAALFAAGFKKGTVKSFNRDFLTKYASETCRGEAVHWAVIACAPLFFLWNYTWAGWVMIAYALMANLPCIISQRYNRLRIMRMLRQKDSRP